MREIVNRLRGQLRIRVECAFPERVLNLCGAREMAFWDLEWESPERFACRVGRKDWHRLRRAAKELDCTLTVVRREGAPYFLNRFRHRTALVTGLVASAMCLFLGSFFIWDFRVEGNETVPAEVILRALEKNGVALGTFGMSLDGEALRNQILLDVPELSWIAVNVSGCRADVQVRERVLPPQPISKRIPSNVVARRSGLVLDVRALDGVACVLPGSSVTEGQILISGVEDTETVGARVLAGMGTVRARTWYTLRTAVPLAVERKEYTGREKRGFSLVLGTRRVKFFTNSSIEGEEYDKITTRQQWSFLGIPLPVTWVEETFLFYERVPAERTAMEAEKEAETVLTEYLHTLTDAHGTVKSTLCASRREDGVLHVTLRAECEEEIGESVPIYLDETGR